MYIRMCSMFSKRTGMNQKMQEVGSWLPGASWVDCLKLLWVGLVSVEVNSLSNGTTKM